MKGIWSIVLLSVLLLLSANNITAQNYTVSGTITDASTNEPAVGTTVYIKETRKGTATNDKGFYSLSLPKGNYTLVISYIGFNEQEIPLVLNKNTKINRKIEPAVITAEEFTVVGEKENQNTDEAVMSTVELKMDKVKTLPAIFGEVDVLKTIQLLPGVQNAGEGNSGFYVRGGGPDQNLILLDGATVYNASHLFGFFSVFNADAIDEVKLVKGGMPAEYGGRLSSVLDISMNNGDMKKYRVDGGIGVISSRLTVQGPIKKDTAAFLVSARRTYAGDLAQPFVSDSSKFKGSNYYFYDFNTKFNYILSSKDKLSLSGYLGRDVFTFKNSDDGFELNTPWGNSIVALKWSHIFNDEFYGDVTASFTDYRFKVIAKQDQFEFGLYSGITDYNLKADYTYLPSILHKIKFGGAYTFHKFTPNSAEVSSADVEFNTGDVIINYANEGALYVSDEWDISEKFKIQPGLRYTVYQHIGPFKRYINDERGAPLDTVEYGKRETVKLYQGLEPRFITRYAFNDKASVKASFTQNYQYIHLATLASVSLPTDQWIPSTEVTKPQFSTQYALGYFRNIFKNKWETSVEVYYKDMKNQVEYKDGAMPQDDSGTNVDNNLTFGKGWSYGAEFFLKKKVGKINGWIGYTLAWTKRQFDDLNNGKPFYPRYDRRHDASVVFNYEISDRLILGATWVYASGNALTLPAARYIIEGQVVNEYGERNSYRMEAFHRMDVALTLKGKETKKFKSSWNFSIYNLYNRKNPYFIYFSNEGNIYNGSLDIKAKQVSLFGIIPSISWNFSF